MILMLVKSLIKAIRQQHSEPSDDPANSYYRSTTKPTTNETATTASSSSQTAVALLRKFDAIVDFLPLIVTSAVTTSATIACIMILCLSVFAAVISGVRKIVFRDNQALFPSYLTIANLIISSAMLAVFATGILPDKNLMMSAVYTTALCVAMLLSMCVCRPFTAERGRALPTHLREAPAFLRMHNIITGYVVAVMVLLSAASWVRALMFPVFYSTGSQAIGWVSTAVTILAFGVCIPPVAIFAVGHAGWTEEQLAEIKTKATVDAARVDAGRVEAVDDSPV